jgi:hypothetical protein
MAIIATQNSLGCRLQMAVMKKGTQGFDKKRKDKKFFRYG